MGSCPLILVKNKKPYFPISVFFVLFFLVGLSFLPASGKKDTVEKIPLVFVSIPPQAYFAERIGGDRINVEVLVKPGQDPHMYEPTPKQMARLAEAGLFFRIGMG